MSHNMILIDGFTKGRENSMLSHMCTCKEPLPVTGYNAASFPAGVFKY